MGYKYEHDGDDELVQDAMLFATNHGDLYPEAMSQARLSVAPPSHPQFAAAMAEGWTKLAACYLKAYRKEANKDLWTIHQVLRFTLALEAYYAAHLNECAEG